MAARTSQDTRDRHVQELVHRWQVAGDAPDGVATAPDHPWRTIFRQRPWPVVFRLATSLLYLAMCVVYVVDGSDLLWLWVGLAVGQAGVAVFVLVHERRLVDLYPDALDAYADASDAPWRVGEDSPYHPVNLRLADIRLRGGPTSLQQWAVRSPARYALALTAAWSVPLLVAIGVAVVATGTWVWLVLAAAILPTAFLASRSLRTRAATTATAVDRWRERPVDAG